MISFADFRRGGELRSPLVSLNAVTARAEVGDMAYGFRRRMRTKTPLRVWTFKAEPRTAPTLDVDTNPDESARVTDTAALGQALEAFAAESGQNVELICFPAKAGAKPRLVGFWSAQAHNGDVWLARDYITKDELADQLKWDYGQNRA